MPTATPASSSRASSTSSRSATRQRAAVASASRCSGDDLRLAAVPAARRAARRMGRRRAGQRAGARLPPDGRRRRRGGRIALVATAVAGEGGVRVEKLAAAVDIGRVVNLDIARQQIEGGLLFGVGLALGSGIEYERGLPVAGPPRRARPADARRQPRDQRRPDRERRRAVRSGRAGGRAGRPGDRQRAVLRDRAALAPPAAAVGRAVMHAAADHPAGHAPAASACCWSTSARPTRRRPRR